MTQARLPSRRCLLLGGHVDALIDSSSRADHEKYVAATYRKETGLIERLKLKELMAKG